MTGARQRRLIAGIAYKFGIVYLRLVCEPNPTLKLRRVVC